MKTALLFFVALMLATNITYAAPVADSCLRMFVPDEHGMDTSLGGPTWYGSYNPDSVMIDTCSGSATYQHLFAKKWFIIQFPKNFYPFNHILDSGEVKEVSDIDSSHLALLNRFLQLQDTLGLIYFQGLDDPPSDSVVMLNPLLKLSFENYQDVDYVVEHFKNTVDSVKNLAYELRAGQLTDVKELEKVQRNRIYPNPVKDYLTIQQDQIHDNNSRVEVFDLDGKKVFESEYHEKIDVSMLQSGNYFLKLKYQIIKFIKE
ncbi:MAG: T9SS type A sorting domain-containing protein [Candidatus Kapaibacterium sp.]